MAKAGTYEVLFELASGGMGTVELAVARGAAGVERLVAIKRILAHLTSTPEVVSRFLDEARIISRLHHANVVGLHQVAEDQRGYYLVFDYVEGETLGGLIDLATVRNERVPLPVVLRVVLDGLNGLNAAHEAKDQKGESLRILHRDVSRQNLIVGSDGVTRLSDFGISKSSLHSTVTNQNYLAGKLIYMPPEYLTRNPIDRRMDIYAMGVTLWVALAGREPWSGATDAQTLQHIMNDGMPLLSSVGVSVPTSIETIVARAVEPRPSDRFPTARQMIDALEGFGRREGSIASQVEVAEYVQLMAGGFLDERRRIIAERLAAHGKPMLSTDPPPPGRQEELEPSHGSASVEYLPASQLGAGSEVAAWPKTPPTRKAAAEAAPTLLSAPASSRSAVLALAGRRRLVAATLVVVGMLAGMAVAEKLSPPSTTPVLAPSSLMLAPSSFPAADSAGSVRVAPLASIPQVTGSTDAAESTTPAIVEEAKSPPEAQPLASALPPKPKRTTVAPASDRPSGLPNQISTANPYR